MRAHRVLCWCALAMCVSWQGGEADRALLRTTSLFLLATTGSTLTSTSLAEHA